MTVVSVEAEEVEWVTSRVGKWSHRLRATNRYAAGPDMSQRPWYVTMCDQVLSNKLGIGRVAFVSSDRPRPECPTCAKRAARLANTP
jgi:hypothetical protein